MSGRIIEKDGKCFKENMTSDGKTQLTEVKKCGCGSWVSVKLINTKHHTGTHRHKYWVEMSKDGTAKEKLIRSYERSIEAYKAQIRLAEEAIKKLSSS